MQDPDPSRKQPVTANPRPHISRSPLALVILALSILGMAAASAIVLWDGQRGVPEDRYLSLYPIILSILALILAFRAERKVHYHLALAGRVLMFLLALSYAAEYPIAVYLLFAGVLIEFSCFEPYPLNLVETLGIAACASTVYLFEITGDFTDAATWTDRMVPLCLFGILVSVFGCFMTRFREMAVDLRREKDRITTFAVQLSRTSSSYQEFAVQAQEAATVKERQRITRDIHDVVGYTLTNNIMLLEAAMDLMQENPLALPNILETARANAEEGLGRIREALYRLRQQETPYPQGVAAINRLARVFEQATSLRVHCEFGNLPWTFSERVDSALYHLVQECLVNSFRHAQATEVRAVMWLHEGAVRVNVSDNGVGAESIREGIGIRGMRERVEALGGSLQVTSAAGGFTVSAVIPTGEERYEN
jgi:signal transduction histidine kinase